MNFNQLRFVRAIAETASFSKAAQLCYVTQPTLSNAIAHLETELGGKLFARTTRKVSMTPLGEHLVPLIDAVLDAKGDLKQAADNWLNPELKLIRIGFTPLVDARLLNTVVEPYLREGGVEVIFKACQVDDLQRRLESNKVDIAIIAHELSSPALESCWFYDEPLYYLPSETAAHLHGIQRVVTLEQICADTFILPKGCGLDDVLHQLFKEAEQPLLEYPGQPLNYSVVEEWASLGVGSAILPESKISASNTTARPLMVSADLPAKLVYSAYWNREVAERDYVRNFIGHFHRVAPRIAEGLAG
ncbi:MAG: LysR family transcriptional regulator [Gammaproteobacteria bacterium]|nr:LysR family transcriptional regulator [Gammaproteobacteria bacterium]